MINVETYALNAFNISQDYKIRNFWDPFIAEYRIITPELELGRGFQVWVKSKQNMKMIVEYVSFIPGKRVAMKMKSKSIFFKTFSGYWDFDEINSKQSKVTFVYQFKTTWLFFIITPVVKYILRKEIRARLEGFQKYLTEIKQKV